MSSLAWRLSHPGGAFSLEPITIPEPRPGTVVVRMEAVPLLSYLGAYIAGNLPYWYPSQPFTPGTNGVGTVEAVGADVYHFTPGQRVFVNPYLVANEVTEEPAQVLIGLTGISPDSGPMLNAWADGTLSEKVLMPVSVLASAEGLDHLSSERVATLGKFIVPLGGLLRGCLRPGETLVVNGATGYFGSAAVLLGLALGAERVIAAGRSSEALKAISQIAGHRVVPVVLSGDVDADAKALKEVSGGHGAHLAFDQVGNASEPNSTLAALRSLRRGGRLVLMGAMTAPLPLSYGDVMTNNWEIIGNFMYPNDAYQIAVSLVRSGLLDLEMVRITHFTLDQVPQAIERAAAMRGLDCTIVNMSA